MQIVIDIPEEEYEEIIFSEDCGLHTLTRAIAKGTPLPKEHGDLKDIETFKLTYGHDGAYYRFKDIIDAPTIIEAESEVRNDTL